MSKHRWTEEKDAQIKDMVVNKKMKPTEIQKVPPFNKLDIGAVRSRVQIHKRSNKDEKFQQQTGS